MNKHSRSLCFAIVAKILYDVIRSNIITGGRVFQFIHIECYAREAGKGKAGGNDIDKVVAENEREEGNCPHVANPAAPIIRYGLSAKEAGELAKKWAETAKDASGRKLRKDGLCLLEGIISYQNTGKNWDEFREDCIDWLHSQYGNRLKSVIEHTDETHPHIHFLVVPRIGERFETIHRGKAAAAEAKAAGKKKGGQNLAYIEAMREWQDEFSRDVAMGHGMTRIGPKKRRLTRAAWNAEQQQAEFLTDAKKQHDALRRRVLREARKEAEKEIARIKEGASNLGNFMGEIAKGIFSAFHTPTKRAKEEAEKAQREKMELAKIAQKILEERLKNENSLKIEALRADLEREKRITASYEEDLKRFLPREDFLKLKRENHWR